MSADYSSTLIYNAKGTAVIVPNFYGNEVKSIDYKSACVIEIDASKRTTAIKISGTELSNEISGGSKNDTLYGGDGADTITDHTSSVDKIYLASGSIDKVTTSKNDTTFKIGKGSIKVKASADKKIIVRDSDNNTIKYVNGELVLNIPSDAVNYNGHSYKFFNDGMTWDEAKTYCENLGGHLVTITESDEQSFVSETLLNNANKNFYGIGCKVNPVIKWRG